MSVNYYLTRPDGDTIHLGLSTAREFMFEAHPGLEAFSAVKAALGEGVITDEAERPVMAEDFVGVVTAKGSGRPYCIFGDPTQYRDADGFLFCRYAFC